jgi:hypothetical protein
MQFIFYDAGGVITKRMNVPSLADAQANKLTHEQILETDQLINNVTDYYVDINSQEVVERLEMTLGYGPLEIEVDEEFMISGIPAGARLVHPGGEEIIEEGGVIWASETPGRFPLRIVRFPYKTEVLYVQVNPL